MYISSLEVHSVILFVKVYYFLIYFYNQKKMGRNIKLKKFNSLSRGETKKNHTMLYKYGRRL